MRHDTPSQYPLLCAEVRSGETYLVDDESLLGRAQRDFLALSGQREASFVVVDLARLLWEFDAATKGKASFTVGDVATLANVGYSVAYGWLSGGIIRATVRPQRGPGRFNEVALSREDMRAAAIVASLHAAGCSRETLKRVAARHLFRSADPDVAGEAVTTAGEA